jgi:hypothetical protein
MFIALGRLGLTRHNMFIALGRLGLTRHNMFIALGRLGLTRHNIFIALGTPLGLANIPKILANNPKFYKLFFCRHPS